ncbi:MAG: response regulator transcription factor [Bacteroidota bacterium]
MNCIIIEDQRPAQRILEKFIADVDSLRLTGTFSDPTQALVFLQKEKVDVLFLDIHLPKISGIEFLKTLSQPPQVILTTAFSDYALEGYDLNVVDYLLKPFSFQRFLQAISKISPGRDSGKPFTASPLVPLKQEIFIKSGHELIKIRIADIIHIQSSSDYTEMHLPSKKLLSNESLKYWVQELEGHRFLRVHKSFIINLDKVERISGNRIYMHNNQYIPIGRAYKEGFIKGLGQ